MALPTFQQMPDSGIKYEIPKKNQGPTRMVCGTLQEFHGRLEPKPAQIAEANRRRAESARQRDKGLGARSTFRPGN